MKKDGIRYSHNNDPATGYAVHHNQLCISINANSTGLADACATACMIMGLNKSIEFIETQGSIDAFFIYSNDDSDYITHTNKKA